MNVSFTGTREGMTEYQKQKLTAWLFDARSRIWARKNPAVFRFKHGCCIGADVEAHVIVRDIFWCLGHIEIFPSTAKTRAPIPEDADVVHDPKPPLMRNRLIVEAGRNILLATPKEMEEQRRGGTWHAVRYAREIGVPVEIFWPRPA